MSSPDDAAADRESPLKAAASLIGDIDAAHGAMHSSAASAARDVTEAKRNARAASEVARRYAHRSYPKVGSPVLLGATQPATPTRGERASNNLFGDDYEDGEGDSFFDNDEYFSSGSGSQKKSDEHAESDDLVSEMKNLLSSSAQQGADAGAAAPSPLPHKSSTAAISGDPALATPSVTSTVGRRRKTYLTPYSTERVAQSHAEEMLALTLKLETMRKELNASKSECAQMRAALDSQQVHSAKLEQEKQQLLMERDEAKGELTAVQSDLENTRNRAIAAEEDANAFLQLAQNSDSKFEQTDIMLNSALQELENLKLQNQLQAPRSDGSDFVHVPTPVQQPKRSVRFADSEVMEEPYSTPMRARAVPPPPPPRSKAAPAAIYAGRQLLRRAKASEDDPNASVIVIDSTPEKIIEKRRKLKARLEAMREAQEEYDASISAPNTNIPRPPPTPPPAAVSDIVMMLREFGRRLHLSAMEYEDQEEQKEPSDAPYRRPNVDVLALRFCESVSIKIENQQKELNELEALCDFLEKKLAAPVPSS